MKKLQANLWRTASKDATPPPAKVEGLLVNVAFTTAKATLAALRQASRLTQGLHGSIRVIVPHVVPYPLDLNHPHVNPEFMTERLRDLTTKAGANLRFEIVACREIAHAYTVALDRNSLVIVAGRKHWWPTREVRLARSLTCKGHDILFVDMEKP